MEDPAVVEVAPAVLDTYVGNYDFGQGRPILTVSREGNQLHAQIRVQPKFEIFPKSASVFFYKLLPAQITFVKGAGGKVTGLIHDQGGLKVELRRVE